MGKTTRWIKIFESEEALHNCVPPGRIYLIQADRKSICIVHSKEGFYAVQEKCPHNGASLSRGWCSEVNSIVCPMHRYHFDLKTGRALSGLGDRLQTYPLKTEENGVFLGIEESGWSWW